MKISTIIASVILCSGIVTMENTVLADQQSPTTTTTGVPASTIKETTSVVNPTATPQNSQGNGISELKTDAIDKLTNNINIETMPEEQQYRKLRDLRRRISEEIDSNTVKYRRLQVRLEDANATAQKTQQLIEDNKSDHSDFERALLEKKNLGFTKDSLQNEKQNFDKDYNSLIKQKEILDSEKEKLNSYTAEQKASYQEKVKNFNAKMQDYQNNKDTYDDKVTKIDALDSEIEYYKDGNDLYLKYSKKNTEAMSQIEEINLQMVTLNLQTQRLWEALPEIEAKISEILATESRNSDFRANMSMIYALMVGAVILGFFFVIWKSGKAGDLFSNQQGLQFITLFSLVIAIILFGVLKILEAKELAALLGAISGYVLGRVSAGEVQSALSGSTNAPAGSVASGTSQPAPPAADNNRSGVAAGSPVPAPA